MLRNRFVAAVLIGLVAAGFGGSPWPQAAAMPSSPHPEQVSYQSGPPRCTTAELTGSLGTPEGAAGSVYVPLILTNSGKRTCALRGFPGVSYVAGDDGHQVGPAAEWAGARGSPVSLEAGKAASAQLRLVNVHNFDEAACKPTPVRGLRVYPPGDTASLFVPMDGTGCAASPPSPQITVETVK
jgi:Protein of unknown function (DUF4232)